MDSRYKVIIASRNIYKEIEITPDANKVKVGFGIECDVRLRKELFFENVELLFLKKDNRWSVVCSENLYFAAGDDSKLLTKELHHGDNISVKYRNSDTEVFALEFVIDFNNAQRKYERKIDLTKSENVLISSNQNANIVLQSYYTTNDTVGVQVMKDRLVLIIKQTTCGLYHNGRKVKGKVEIKNRDFFSIADFFFYYKDGFLWTEIREDLLIKGLSYTDVPEQNSYPKFNRNTRIKTVVSDESIEILDPPAKPQKPKNNLFMNLLPSIGMLVASAVMAFMGGAMIIFSVVSGAMAIVTSILSVIQGNKDYKRELAERIEKYNKYIENKRAEIKEYREHEKSELEKIYIDQSVEQVLFSDFSCELFDRQPDDEDFLVVRLGTGNIEASRRIDYKKQERLEVEDDLQLIPERMAEEYLMLEDAPVVCDLKKNNAIGIIGAEKYRFSILKNMVVDICARQYHTDVKLFFVASEEHKERITWLRFLPQVNNELIGIRNIVCDDESKNRIFDFLYKEFTLREQGKKGEHCVIFFYDEYGFQNHPLSKFVDKAKELSVTFVFMADNKGKIPMGCEHLIIMGSGDTGCLVDVTNKEDAMRFTYKNIDNYKVKQIVEFMAPIYTEEISLEGTLTKNISLFEMMNILGADDLDLKTRWEDSKVFQSMAAPIGVTKSGIINLDLHDKAHGPHGLVAGTTGSGKSEVLQTYILSIATIFHPYEVSFVIIDFKGGGMVNQFKDLPHLLGAITNIDGKEIERSLKSIKAELQKRQRLFAEAEVNHIDKYIQKYRAGSVKTPIPHLVLIVDEFAELKAEQPEFMKELISAARIGRSLGVHLILATQKPSGQVDEQIWSNSRFKLCLKVQSQEDSNEVLKSPLAAEIKEPGRAYLQVGNNEVFELFQSAYSGAPEKIVDNNVKEFSIFNVSDSGKRTPVFIQKKKKSSGINLTQLEAIVNHVNKYCTNNGIKRLDNICLPSLPKNIDYPISSVKNSSMVELGIYDDPDNQIQEAAMLDIDNKNTLIIGSSQYGKTNLLQSLIRTIASSCSPKEANIYIIDFGSMVLKNFEELNHVGGVVCSSEDEKLKNLFKLLFSEISSRKEKLVSVGVSSFASYIEAGYTDLPHIYLIIDNLTALIELYLEEDDSLLTLVREGNSVGISTVVANPQTAGVGYRYLSNFANKVALYCNDSNEYGNMFEHVRLQPDEVAGRCILELDKRLLECQTYLAFDGEREIERVREMQSFVTQINIKYCDSKAKIIPCIPSVLTEEALLDNFDAVATSYKVPIGLTYNEVTPYYLDLAQLGIMGVCGKENTGHHNFVQYIISTLEINKHINPARVVIIDDVSRKYVDLKESSIVDVYTLDTTRIAEILQEWYLILEERYNNLVETGTMGETNELLLMFIQNNDVAKKIYEDMDLMNQFEEMVSRFKGMNVAFIFTNYANASVSYDAPEPLRMIKQEQHILYFENLDNLKPFDVPYEELKANKKKLGLGDAYYIQDNVVIKLKMVKSGKTNISIC